MIAASAGAQKQQQNQSNPKTPSHLMINSGELLSANGMPIQVTHFDALVGGEQKAEPRDGGKKPVVTITRGVAFLSRDAITKLLNGHLSGGIKDLSVETEPGRVTIKGKVHKGVDLPFTVEGPVSATTDGMIKLQASEEKAAHLPQGLSKAIGFNDLSKIVGNNAGKGIKADKNSVTFDPDLMWGLPIHGRVVKAATNAKGLLLTFGPDAAQKGKAAGK